MPEHLGISDRMRIESFRKIGEDVILGQVRVDREKCQGCGYCVKVCPAASLEVVEKKARMITDDIPMCMACGNCTAICPDQAIELVRMIEFKKYFRYLDRGKPERPRRF